MAIDDGSPDQTRAKNPPCKDRAGCRRASGVVADLLGSSTGTDLRRCSSAGLAVRMAVQQGL
jgi:hypothetical protein